MRLQTDASSPFECDGKGALPYSSFDTRSVPMSQRFELVRELMRPLYGMEPLPESGHDRFDVRMAGWRINDLLLGATQLIDGNPRFVRENHGVAGHQGEPFQLFFYEQGGFCGVNGGRSLAPSSGDIALLDLGRSLDVEHSRQSKHLTLIIPREVLLSRLGQPLDGGLLLPGARCATQLLAHHLTTLVRLLPQADRAELPVLYDGLLALLATTIRAVQNDERIDGGAQAKAMLGAVCDYVESHLEQPELSVTMICRFFNCSRSYLYRLFQPLGGVSHYIRKRRLQRCLRQLIEQPPRSTRVIDVALRYGFTNQSHFSRLFKAEFGFSPSEANSLGAMEECSLGDTRSNSPAFFRWLCEV